MSVLHPALINSALFSGIASDDLVGLLGCLNAKTLQAKKNQILFNEGDPALYFGVVLSGHVQMQRDDYFGNRSIVAHIAPGELFAETYACAGVAELPVSVLANTDCEVLLLDSRKITATCCNACAFHNRIIYNLLQLVAKKNLVFDQKISITSKRTTREKLTAYLLNEAKLCGSNSFEIPYTRQQLADYLDVDRSGLSVEIGKLRNEGKIACNRNKFTIFNTLSF